MTRRRQPDPRPNATDRGYGQRWRAARAAFLSRHPLCWMCAEAGRQTPATVVDHHVPHRGDKAKFWDSSNWRPVCATCHNSAKQSDERTGRIKGADASGVPIDPGHHWNQG